MLNKFIATHIGFPLQDKVMKTPILETGKLLDESQFWGSSKMEEYQLTKLKQLIEYSYTNVPYYRALFKKHNIHPDDIKKLDDIKIIPVLTKELLRENHQSLISEIAQFKHVKKGKTGGTTGTPVPTYKDTSERSFTWASYYRWYNWMGIKREDKVLTFWGTATVIEQRKITKLKNYLKNRIQNNLTISSFNLNDTTLPLVYKKLMSYDPVLIKGYVSAIVNVALFMRTHNLKPNNALKAISTTTETLLPMYRSLIEEVFNVKVFDQYGCGEVAAIAYECSAHLGLHLTEEHVVFEILDDNNNNIINQTGNVTVTSLDNYVMPLIRYQNGDVATLSNVKCSCGVNSALIKSIEGRVADTIKLKNGSKVHGVFFTSLFYELGITAKTISRFQIQQLKSGEIDIKLETASPIPKEIVKKIHDNVSRFIDIHSINEMNNIPSESNGKFRYIKSYTSENNDI